MDHARSIHQGRHDERWGTWTHETGQWRWCCADGVRGTSIVAAVGVRAVHCTVVRFEGSHDGEGKRGDLTFEYLGYALTRVCCSHSLI